MKQLGLPKTPNSTNTLFFSCPKKTLVLFQLFLFLNHGYSTLLENPKCEYHLEFARFDLGGTHATEYKDHVCSNFLDHSTNPTSTRPLKRSVHRVNSSINSYGYSSELVRFDHGRSHAVQGSCFPIYTV